MVAIALAATMRVTVIQKDNQINDVVFGMSRLIRNNTLHVPYIINFCDYIMPINYVDTTFSPATAANLVSAFSSQEDIAESQRWHKSLPY